MSGDDDDASDKGEGAAAGVEDEPNNGDDDDDDDENGLFFRNDMKPEFLRRSAADAAAKSAPFELASFAAKAEADAVATSTAHWRQWTAASGGGHWCIDRTAAAGDKGDTDGVTRM